MERFSDAVDDYTVALIYYPDYASAYYNRALAKYHLGRLAEACEDLKVSRRLGMTIDKRVEEALCASGTADE